MKAKVIITRLILSFFLMQFWNITQQLIKQHEVTQIVDASHVFTEQLNSYIRANPNFADWMLIFSSLLLDISVAYLGIASLLSKGWRTPVATAVVIVLRQICQFTISFPLPEGLYFDNPGFPSLFVTYDVKTDFYFSGHTSLMVVSSIDLVRRTRSKVLFLLMSTFCLFQMSVVLIFRFHYIPDVITALFAAVVSDSIGGLAGSYLDEKPSIKDSHANKLKSRSKIDIADGASTGLTPPSSPPTQSLKNRKQK